LNDIKGELALDTFLPGTGALKVVLYCLVPKAMGLESGILSEAFNIGTKIRGRGLQLQDIFHLRKDSVD
jgi:hypothetical protein